MNQEAKKVTIFVGSAHKAGATYRAACRLREELESYGDVHGEVVVVSDYSLGVCRGCKICFQRGEERCPLHDDRDLLIQKMQGSDGVVFASPNYSFQVSAILKIFLDRLGFMGHRPRFHGKTFTSLVVQGIYRGGQIVKYLQFVGKALGFNVVKGSCIRTLEPMDGKALDRMESKLAAQGWRLHARLLRSGHPQPSLFGLMMFRMSRTGFQQSLAEDNLDHLYYRQQGWFKSDYFYPTRLGPFKKAAGAFFDWVAARVYPQRKVRA
jgi:multimeric flavodoxin WrbA